MNFSAFKLLRASARVSRLHTLPSLYRQSVGEHTFNLWWMAHFICAPRKISDALTTAIMLHDVPEVITGDVPGPTLSRTPELKRIVGLVEDRVCDEFGLLSPEITDWEKDVLLYCDKMEFAVFALEEVYDGNSKLLPRVRGTLLRLDITGLKKVTPAAEQLWEVMNARCKEFPEGHGEEVLHGWPG